MPQVHSFIYSRRGSLETLKSTTGPFVVTSRFMGRPGWHGNLARIIHGPSGAGGDARVSQTILPSALRDTVEVCLMLHAFESLSRFATNCSKKYWLRPVGRRVAMNGPIYWGLGLEHCRPVPCDSS